MTDRPGWEPAPAEPPDLSPPGAGRPPPQGTPRRDVVVVVLIALLALALVAGTVFAVVTRDRGEAPQAAPTDVPETAPEPAPTQPAPDGGGTADIDEIARQVAEIRGLPLRRPVRSRVVSEEELADKISEIAFSEMDADRVEADRRLLVALRLAEPDLDLAGLVEDLYREQVQGVYVPAERTLYVTADGSATPRQRMTIAHEVTHALQDRAFDLEDLRTRHEDDADAALAVLSLVEGDAVLTQQLWAMRHLSADERREAFAEGPGSSDAVERAPDYVRAALFFPYQEGGRFVGELYRQGGFEAVDAAFAEPPTTTEQIIHPERYLAGETAVDVEVAGRPGGAWERSATYEFGQFDVREMLREHLDSGAAESVATGWGGGQIRSWVRADDTAVGLALAFDTRSDWAEACSAMVRWYEEAAGGEETGDGTFRGDDDHMALTCSPDEVRVGLAPEPALARRLAGSP